MERRRRKRRNRIRMRIIIALAIAVVICIAAAGIKERQRQAGERYRMETAGKAVYAERFTDVHESVAVVHEFPDAEEWVKPHIEGMIPVYGRSGIDYISLEDFELIGKTVFAEAKTEEFEGQVAVAEVILNRVESMNFPDTVEEVIKQAGAFASWGNGSVEDAPLDDECLEAVQDAVNERVFPDSVVYFREGRFHSFGTPYTVIGHHYFSSEEGEDR